MDNCKTSRHCGVLHSCITQIANRPELTQAAGFGKAVGYIMHIFMSS
jgi:hypothetical protein